MSKSKVIYNPRLSVAENAQRNGVKEETIRYYIKTHGIDREHERKVNIVNDIRKYLKQFPNATKEEVAKKTKHGINTTRKYWEIAKGNEIMPSNLDSKKHPKIDVREYREFYATHPSVTSDILRVETFADDILEPFCGSGTMAEVIAKAGHNVIAYDIVDRRYGAVCNFFDLEVVEGQYDIITNPPYNDYLTQIINKCLNIAKNKVAILMPLRYLSGKARYSELYQQQPPSRVYVYQERICIAKNADFEKYSDAGANMEIYAWFIWDKAYQGETLLRWISNEKATL